VSGAAAKRRPAPAAPLTSLSAFARRHGVSIPTVRRGVFKGRLTKSVIDTPGGYKIVDVELADREWAASANHGTLPAADRERLDGDEIPEISEDMTLTEASVIEKRWRGKMVQLEYRKKAGDLIEASEVEAGLAEVFSECRTKLLGVPIRARQRLPHLTKEDMLVIEELQREALEALATPAIPATRGGRE